MSASHRTATFTTKTVTVTPQQAENWLQNLHEHQRPLKPSVIDRYMEEMKREEWYCTAQGIVFDWRGKLMDGQHRLIALVRLGVPVQMRVTNGEDPANFKAYDCGSIRTPSDRTILDADNKERNKYLVRLVRAYVTDAIMKSHHPTSADMLLNAYMTFKKGFDLVMNSSAKYVKKNSNVMAAVAIYAHEHPGKAQMFLAKMTHEADCPANDPAGRLDQYLTLRHNKGNVKDYWYAVNACKIDARGETCGVLKSATEDMAGNRLVKLRAKRSEAHKPTKQEEQRATA
jgi:hypothetical protein